MDISKSTSSCSKDMNDCPVILVWWSQTDGWTERDAYEPTCVLKNDEHILLFLKNNLIDINKT